MAARKVPAEESSAKAVLAALHAAKDPKRAAAAQRYFKTGKGEYGEGDRFLGIAVPAVRALVRAHPVSLETAVELLASPLHEVRLFALLAMVRLVHRADDARREEMLRAYLDHRAGVNNWDLVDSSAPFLMVPALAPKKRKILDELVRSPSLWDRRIAVLATFHAIREGDFTLTVRLAKALLTDPEDLLHKAVGWMLREIGERGDPGLAVLRGFLEEHAHEMPRTMLRYAIEKLDATERRRWLGARTFFHCDR